MASIRKKNIKPAHSVNLQTALLEHRLALAEHRTALAEHRATLIEHTTALNRFAAVAAPAIDTDAIVDNCIRGAVGGASFDSGSVLRQIPVNPNDLVKCLNGGLSLIDPHRYTNGLIPGSSTVQMLRTDAHNKYILSHQ